MFCSAGFVWNDDTEDCDFPENVDCDGKYIIFLFL